MSVVSPKSLFNHLLACGGLVLSRFGVEYTSIMPSFVSVEPSNVCQLKCPQCPCGIRGKAPSDTSFMSMDTYKKILSDCHGWVHTMQFYFQGEPLLNPCLPEMIQLAHAHHIYTTCSTNALALTPLLAEKIIAAGLDRIIVSIDGMSEDSYCAYRHGGSLNQALKGLICLRDAKDRLSGHTHIELQCLRLSSNQQDWSLLERSYRQMGADSLTLKTAQFYDYEKGNPLMPSDERYSRYHHMEDGRFIPKNRMSSVANQPCKRIQMGCVITTNGNVLPCCFDKSSTHVMGNVNHQSLRSIWHNDAFQAFRSQVRKNRMVNTICQNCTE